ncbi:MAG: DUF493 domain-containing protein [Spirochaetales bacterium]|nr:DUF493 domain-containing protein [Spirochaetales bacterium]
MNQKDKKKINYPCSWSFRVIGLNQADMERDVKIIMAQREHSLKPSNKKGKYLSLNLSMTVGSEAERNSVFNAIKNCDSITMVL